MYHVDNTYHVYHCLLYKKAKRNLLSRLETSHHSHGIKTTWMKSANIGEKKETKQNRTIG